MHRRHERAVSVVRIRDLRVRMRRCARRTLVAAAGSNTLDEVQAQRERRLQESRRRMGGRRTCERLALLRSISARSTEAVECPTHRGPFC